MVTGGSEMLTGTSKVVTGDMESSGICFEEMNYAVLNKSDEVKDGTLGLVPGTSKRPW